MHNPTKEVEHVHRFPETVSVLWLLILFQFFSVPIMVSIDISVCTSINAFNDTHSPSARSS